MDLGSIEVEFSLESVFLGPHNLFACKNAAELDFTVVMFMEGHNPDFTDVLPKVSIQH